MTARLFQDPDDASERFRTIELLATVSYDSSALARESVRAAEARGLAPRSFRVYSVGEDVRGREQYSWRVWWDRPSRWRDEIRWRSDLTDVAVVRGNSSLIYVAGQRTMYTSERPEPDAGSQVIDAPRGIVELPTVESRLAIFPLFRPPLPQSQWAFAIVGDEEMYLRRRVRRVRAKRRSDASPSEVLSGYWQGIDEYECVVDDELRILLSLAGIAQGRPVATIASDAVRVNVDLADDIFSFVPPRGARIAPISLSN